MNRALVWSVSLWVMVCATGAAADENRNSILKGDYGFTGTAVCNIQGATGAVSVGLFTFNGTRTFHGDGTGTSSWVSRAMTAGVLAPEGDSDVVDSFTYAVNGDGSWTRTVEPGTWTGTLTNGPRAGVTFSVSQGPSSIGFISEDAETLTAITTDAVLETLTYSDGGVQHRFCQRSFTLTKRHS
jgi:hypothetical protein